MLKWLIVVLLADRHRVVAGLNVFGFDSRRRDRVDNRTDLLSGFGLGRCQFQVEHLNADLDVGRIRCNDHGSGYGVQHVGDLRSSVPGQ